MHPLMMILYTEEKDNFYELLTSTLTQVSSKDFLIVGGDFNAQCGPRLPGENNVVGRFSIGRRTDNGSRLLSFAEYCSLFAVSTNFKH